MAHFNLKISRIDTTFESTLAEPSKFYADRFTFNNDRYFILMNGVNLAFKEANKEKNIQTCISAYEKKGETFFSDFRGSFCGALLDKPKQKWIIFTNHIGDQKVYYSINNDSITFGSDVFFINDLRKQVNLKSNINMEAAYCLLSYGYMPKDYTLSQDIKRLTAGHYVTIINNNIELKKFFNINNTPNHKLSDRDCIERIDDLFSKAIELEYKKDISYKLAHIASMSGGLDCRMTNFVAHKMGYTGATNITFAQSGSLDMTIAQQMSAYLHNEWIFKSLDNGNFLKQIDKLTRIANGHNIYSGSAHALNTLKDINFDHYGLLHSGQLGDVTIGTYSPTSAYKKPRKIKATSTRLIHKTNIDYSSYPNEETAIYNIRGLNGILTGNFVSQQYTEVSSPFLDIDLLNFCMSIPAEKRALHGIYKKWILEKHPEAALFKWEQTNTKLTSPTLSIRGKIVPIQKIPRFIIEGVFHNIGKPINNTYSKKTMNPFNYWYKTNNSLSQHLNDYYIQHLDIIKDNELKNDCETMFSKGDIIEKMQVITLLSALKQLNI